MEGDKARYLEELYKNEMHNMYVYAKFAEIEKQKELKEILKTL